MLYILNKNNNNIYILNGRCGSNTFRVLNDQHDFLQTVEPDAELIKDILDRKYSVTGIYRDARKRFFSGLYVSLQSYAKIHYGLAEQHRSCPEFIPAMFASAMQCKEQQVSLRNPFNYVCENSYNQDWKKLQEINTAIPFAMYDKHMQFQNLFFAYLAASDIDLRMVDLKNLDSLITEEIGTPPERQAVSDDPARAATYEKTFLKCLSEYGPGHRTQYIMYNQSDLKKGEGIKIFDKAVALEQQIANKVFKSQNINQAARDWLSNHRNYNPHHVCNSVGNIMLFSDYYAQLDKFFDITLIDIFFEEWKSRQRRMSFGEK